MSYHKSQSSHKKDIWAPPIEYPSYRDDTFIIYDTEYTTWDGAQERGWSGENEYREIVQIGAIKVKRDTLEVVDTLDVLSQPVFNPQLSDFFTNLTGITNEDIAEKGISFENALQQFVAFCATQHAFSYGNDNVIIGENIGYYKISDHHIHRIHFASIAPLFRMADPATNNVVSGHLAEHFGVPLGNDHQEHNALADCYSILNALRYLVQEKNYSLPFTAKQA